ncbi:membrane protein insertase YidC [Paenibacillus arenilitoris]|uniref:Membrane protein insertase YidC n=1 Tax=Paenibacillus arenilitoris TaxID=2772299 RepID=A0A927H4B0_9BACL|nr:membrane protein insertase YidC [Paenibacillus arenilitoris]MBD2868201.1 membrane protein insertase YidC [Paenibacillus arenilitoris]
MRWNNVFPTLTANRLILAAAMLAGLLLVSGCGTQAGTIDGDTPGFFNHYVIYPLSAALQYLAGLFQGSYGLAIVGITLIIRLALLPLMMRQYRSQSRMREKMAAMQPELKQLQEKYKGKTDAESKQKLQQETLQLYQKHQVNPLAMGCLPMLIQMPILMGLYSAIRMTPELAEHSFLWFKLGSPDIVLPIVAALVYFVQFKVSQTTQPGTSEAQQKQLAFMGYLSPILMGVFALSAPAAISLYWVTGGLFMIAQSYLAKKAYAPKADVALEGGA